MTAANARRGHVSVVPICVSVSGRARLRVAGLRGRPRVGFHLEDRLSGHSAIRRASANPVTGNLLVLFEARSLPLDELIAAVARYRNGASRQADGAGERAAIDLAPSAEHPAWHAVPTSSVISTLDASPERGLSNGDAANRLALAGPNRLPTPEPRSVLAILLDQLASVPVLLLAGAAVVSLASGALLDAAVILAVVGINAALIAAATLGAYGIALGRYGVGAQSSTVTFSTLTSAQLAYALSCRSTERSGLALLDQNPALMGALGGTLGLQIGTIALPFLRRVLGTTPLGLTDWLLVATGAATPLMVSELRKGLRRPASDLIGMGDSDELSPSGAASRRHRPRRGQRGEPSG